MQYNVHVSSDIEVKKTGENDEKDKREKYVEG